MSDVEWYVYIIRSSDQSLYTGITTDPERRFSEHRSGKAGAKYFRGRTVVQMAVVESNHSRSSASVREAQIKRLPKTDKLRLFEDCL
jgi:putative endonuclease